MSTYREPLEDELESCRPETASQKKLRLIHLRLRLMHRAKALADIVAASDDYRSVVLAKAAEIDQDAIRSLDGQAIKLLHKRRFLSYRLCTPHYGMAEFAKNDSREFVREMAALNESLKRDEPWQ